MHASPMKIVRRKLSIDVLAVCLVTRSGAGLITGVTVRYGTSLLGRALLLDALTGVASVRFTASVE
jgi:hypothetical protein